MNYEKVQPVVDAMCISMRTEPTKWRFEATTIQHRKKFNKVEIWVDLTNSYTEIWNGYGTEPTFSQEQGAQLHQAHMAAITIMGTANQQRLIDSL